MSWTTWHQELLDVLEAERLLPELCRRLSRERIDLSAERARSLRDWARSIQADAGWDLVGPALSEPKAWPQVWEDACRRGWSARTDHHNALFLLEACDEALADGDFEVALYTWRQGLEAWRRVLRTDYLGELLESLCDDPQSSEAREVARTLLVPAVATREAALREALGLDNLEGVTPIARPRAHFGWNALATARRVATAAKAGGEADPTGTLRALGERAEAACRAVLLGVLGQFQRQLDDVDLACAPGEAIAAPFEWLRDVFSVLDIGLETDAGALPTPGADDVLTTVVAAAVDTGWKLRSLERDREPDLQAPVLDTVAPFNERLFARLNESEALFGHNVRCADFLVFQGERARSLEQRMEAFERALEVSPGHRNASMLLSYALIERVNLLLLKTSPVPDFASRMPGAGARVEAIVREAVAQFERAAELYPLNTNLDDYRADLERECARFGIPFGQAADDTADAGGGSDDDCAGSGDDGSEEVKP